MLAKRRMHVRGRLGIAERVLDSRDDADHLDRLLCVIALGDGDRGIVGVTELDLPAECVLAGPTSASTSSMIATAPPSLTSARLP